MAGRVAEKWINRRTLQWCSVERTPPKLKAPAFGHVTNSAKTAELWHALSERPKAENLVQERVSLLINDWPNFRPLRVSGISLQFFHQWLVSQINVTLLSALFIGFVEVKLYFTQARPAVLDRRLRWRSMDWTIGTQQHVAGKSEPENKRINTCVI